MKPAQKIVTLVLAALVIATLYGLLRTGRESSKHPATVVTPEAVAEQAPVVDQAALVTARQLAQMPTSAAERPLAEEALRIADREMDLAFATAVRDTTDHPPALTAEAKTVQARLQKAERALENDQAQAEQLTAAQGKASGAKQDALDDQLSLAKAQLELDQDEVDEAKQDLMRAGGDPQARIEAMVHEHEEASRISDATRVTVTGPTELRGLIHRFQQWSALHGKQLQLWRAKHQAESAAAMFSAKHDALEAQLKGERESGGQQPAAATAEPTPIANEISVSHSREQSAALLKTTKRKSSDEKALSTFDKRMDNEKQLAEVYGKWIGVVVAEQRGVLNRALRGVLIILAIGLIGLFFDRWIEKLLGKVAADRRRIETLRTVTRVALQVVAVLLILLVIFGPPTQLGTILGLAGAGLTVALKDFIVGFLGWFVLMGKNGIRLGDWVEINGVTGEVVELGMFHTVLLETGNWTDSGHPTGRRVTFTNSFAIEGHYFNFSTSGQWLWDELQIVLPSGKDPYPIIDAFQKKVSEATSKSAPQAEQEWQSAARSRDMSALTAAPAINVKPVIGGVEISVRYVTRASERYQLRAKLYQAAVDLLGEHPEAQLAGAVKPAK
jgi:small-conductance mechanosensitive channel